MNISINLVQFETDQYAICEATVEQEGRRVSVYGMAVAGEPGRIVELAQSRALQLAQQLIQQGPAALLAGEPPLPSATIPAGHEPTTALEPEPLPTWFMEEVAPVTTVEEGPPEVAAQLDNAIYLTEIDPASDVLPVEEPAPREEPAGSAAADVADDAHKDEVVDIPW